MNNYPLGSWKNTAINIKLIDNNTISCDLRKINGEYKNNILKFKKNILYENSNGEFKISYNFLLPKGGWINSSKNVKNIDKIENNENNENEKVLESNLDKVEDYENDEDIKTSKKDYNKISAELCNMDSKYILNTIKFRENDIVENIDGYAFVYKDKYNDILNNIENIPKKIFQTHKSFSYMLENDATKRSYDSWSRFKDYEYNFYDDKMCEEFIKNNFENNVYNAYIKCPIPVMKADLWRYCIIYIYGGIYADSDTICLDTPNIFSQKKSYFVGVPENDVHLCNWIFAAPPRSPVLLSVINLSVDRILNHYEKKQHMVHYYTGPGVLTDGIEYFLKKNNLHTFVKKILYSYAYKNYWLHFFNYDFHDKNVKHLFTGGNGWTKDIQKYLNQK